MTDVQPTREEMAAEVAEVLTVAPSGRDQFTGVAPDWFGDRVFGGVVVGQVLAAAARSVGDGVRPHSLHGYFLRPVVPGATVDLTVDRVRDGRSFTLRRVEVAQGGRLAASMAVSCCADEAGPEYQPSMPEVPEPGELPEISDFHGPVDLRDAGPTPPEADGTRRSTRRTWFKLPRVFGDDPALHTAVLGYLSDLTDNSFRPLSLDQWDGWTDASLDHAAWFHRPARADQWLLFDLHAAVNTGGRSLLRGSMYDRGGHLVLTMAQELLIRPVPPGG